MQPQSPPCSRASLESMRMFASMSSKIAFVAPEALLLGEEALPRAAAAAAEALCWNIWKEAEREQSARETRTTALKHGALCGVRARERTGL